MSILHYMEETKKKYNEPLGFTDHDLAVLADWANEWKEITPNKDWKRAYALIREGFDLLLRRRARSTVIMAEEVVVGKAAKTHGPTKP